METLEDSLCTWVTDMQLSHTGTKRRCSRLADLADGNLLNQLLALISPSHFSEDFAIQESRDIWILKFCNLQRLRRNIDSYIDQDLRVPRYTIHKVDLTAIAQHNAMSEILKLLEEVVYVILNCPLKNAFIQKILELDEDCKADMKVFLQRVIENEARLTLEPSRLTDTIFLAKHEFTAMKTEKLELVQQLTAFETALLSAQTDNAELTTHNARLREEQENLQLQHKPHTQDLEVRACHALELRCAQAEMQLSALQESHNAAQRAHTQELSSLTDELDLAHSKSVQLVPLEKSLGQYKRRLENFSAFKEKTHDLERANERLRTQLHQQDIELGEYVKTRRVLQRNKEELAREKERSCSLAFTLDNKEKQVKSLAKDCKVLTEKLELNTNILNSVEQELTLKVLETPRPDDSFSQVAEDALYKISFTPRNYDPDRVIESLEQALLLHKQKLKERKESKLMLNEEMCVRLHHLQLTIEALEAENEVLTERVEKQTECILHYEETQFDNAEIQHDLTKLQADRAELQQECRGLLTEKDAIYKQLLASKEDSLALHSQLTTHEYSLHEKTMELKLIQEERKQYLGTEQYSGAQLAELNSLKTQLAEKTQIIKQMHRERENTLKSVQEGHIETMSRFEQDREKQLELVTAQVQDAFFEVEKEKAHLAFRLQKERQNSLVSWKKTLQTNDPRMCSAALQDLKRQLLCKEKEIEYLIRANNELKQVWKDTANMLKTVWKELGLETKKIKSAIRRNFTCR